MWKKIITSAIVIFSSLFGRFLMPNSAESSSAGQLSLVALTSFEAADDDDIVEMSGNRSANTTPFSGTATDVDIGDSVSSTFYYPLQKHYYRFQCSKRQYLAMNYSGPNASMRIFYSNFFLDSDYLVSVPYLSSAPDCHLFNAGSEYIIELSPRNISIPTAYSFQMEALTLSTFTNHEQYALHQVFDSSSNLGYHYQVVYLGIETSSYTPTSCYLNSYSLTPTHANELDSDHWFFNANDYPLITDDRRVVVDTGYGEYSAIAKAIDSYWNNYSDLDAPVLKGGRFSGTFISETTVLTCAHAVYPQLTRTLPNQTIETYSTALTTSISFHPGINTYSGTDYYGTYAATELYTSVSYVLSYAAYDHMTYPCSDYDWAICLTNKTVNGSRTHSYMGISGFSISPGITAWEFGRCAGYPKLQSEPADLNLYLSAPWTCGNPTNDIYLDAGGKRLYSYEIITSGGQSGGPMYYKSAAVQNGHVVTTCNVLGIVSAKDTSGNSGYPFVALFYRNTGFIVNLVAEVTAK